MSIQTQSPVNTDVKLVCDVCYVISRRNERVLSAVDRVSYHHEVVRRGWTLAVFHHTSSSSSPRHGQL